MKDKKINKRNSTFKTISVSSYINQCIGYTAKILNISKTQLLTQIFNTIIKESCLLKSDASMELSHDNGLISIKLTGNPFCQFGTISLPTNLTDKEVAKEVFKKVYGEEYSKND